MAVLFLHPPGHLHPARPPPLHHLQHPQGDHHDDGFIGKSEKEMNSFKAFFIEKS